MSQQLTIHEVAAELRTSPDWVRKECIAGRLDHIERSGTKRITRLIERDALDRYIAERRVERDSQIHERVRRMQNVTVPDVFGALLAKRGTRTERTR